MKLPIEIIANIFSFLHSNEIKIMELPYNYLKMYLHERLGTQKNELWYRGVYNNINSKCFVCAKCIRFSMQIMVICINCDLSLDGFYYYPHLCVNCVNENPITRGRIFSSHCPSCKKKRMNLAIECYS